MKVQEVVRSEEEVENCDYRNALQIVINGKRAFKVVDGEPEDSNLNRDFNDCYNITGLMKSAWEAGKNGEVFELIQTESADI